MFKRKLADNLKRVQERIADAADRVGRKPTSVTLVAVTKYVGMEHIHALTDLGVVDLGESRPQELARRAAMWQEWRQRRPAEDAAPQASRPRWHLVGHLQRNKVRAVIPFADLIHSVDSLRLAEEIDAQSAKLPRVTPILLEVNASGEAAKQGVAVAATTHLAEQISSLKHLQLRGLMAMAPLTQDSAVLRHTFGRVRELYEEILSEGIARPHFRELSLGMSNDFEYGIEAGATLVRIGSALYEGIELAPQPVEAE